MDNSNLEESLQILHEENNSMKQEIIAHLETLTELHESKNVHMENHHSSNYTGFILELCKYQQRINHKLTTIKYDLQKHLSLYKPPVLNQSDSICEESEQICADDISTVKEESLKVINKMNAFISKSSSPCCNIAKDTYDNLSDHTKSLLENMTRTQKEENEETFGSKNNTCLEVATNSSTITKLGSSTELCETNLSENLLINLDDDCSSFNHAINSDMYCGHFPYIEKNFPQVSKSCLSNTVIKKNDTSTSKINLLDYSEIYLDSNPCLNHSKNFSGYEVKSEKYVVLDDDRSICNNSQSENNCVNFPDIGNEFVPQTSKSAFSNPLINEEDIVKSTINPNEYMKIDYSKSYIGSEKEATKFEQNENDVKLNAEHLSSSFVDSGNYCEGHFPDIDKGKSYESNKQEDIKRSMINLIIDDAEIDCSKSFTESENNLAFVDDKCIEKFVEKRKDKQLKDKSHNKISINTVEVSSNIKNQNEQKSDNVIEKEDTPQQEAKVHDGDENTTNNFTAQDKIIKLGLEDRITVFEKTRQVAQLPDLRLRSTGVPNEKGENQTFEIQDKVINSFVNCTFCHVESPSNFYLQIDDEETSMLDSLNLLITHHFIKTKTPFNSKSDASRSVGDYCCVFVEERKSYFRAKIIDWYLHESKRVQVQLVDYGKILNVHYKFIRKLTKQFAMLPKLSIRCYLPLLYPPGSTKINVLEKWPLSTINALKELSGINRKDQPKFRICFFDKKGEKYAVDMLDTSNPDIDTIGQLLIDLSHATQLIFEEDDPLDLVREDMEIEMMEQCDNLNEVVLGYDPKDEGRICRFTRRDGTCFKGENCKFEHTALMRGGFTQDQDIVPAFAETELILPKKGDEIIVKFTMLKNAYRFYMNISKFADSLNYLVASMQKNVSKYEKFKIMPALGEVVLVKHWTQQWLRARVVDHAFDEFGGCIGVQVFMVDIGDVNDVPLTSVRKIQTEHLKLPFQAVECVLYGYKPKENVDPEEVDKFFYDNMVYREFEAEVMDVSDMFLCLKVTYKNRDVGKILMDRGFLDKVEKEFFPASNSKVIPG